MKHFVTGLVLVLVLAACNNGAEKGEGVGDSLAVDPTTAQPITTDPDTVGPSNNGDTTLKQNQ